MTSIPPPHGLTEVDYEAIEAAVTETVRGRWFLSEFARRNRLAETRQLLDAMARIETAIASTQNALPTADPSIRLMIQRIKEIAAQLGEVAVEMRDAGVEEHFVSAVDLQARAVAGMMRAATPAREPLPASAPTALPLGGGSAPAGERPDAARIPADATRVPPMPRMPRADLPPSLAPIAPAAIPAPMAPLQVQAIPEDPRLAALSGLDGMTLANKLALFS
jgi:hypothetical protein